MLEFPSLTPWSSTGLIALAAALVAAVAHRIAAAVLRRVTTPLPLVHTVVVACIPVMRVLLPLIALQAVWQGASDDLPHIAGVRHLNGLALIAGTCWLAITAIQALANGIVARHPADVEDNLTARRIATQARVLARTAMTGVVMAGVALMLMTFPGARQVGASLLASAGVVGIVAGIAARPVFSNMIAGLQIALAQPIRIDDVLIIEGEWGRVEEITSTYVVLRIWDERRLIIPLQWFIEHPFQNWTRTSSEILGTVFLYADYRLPLEPLRAELQRVLATAPEWDKRVNVLQLTDVTERTIQIRVLVSARSSGLAFDLRCRVREALVTFIQREYPDCLPQVRIPEGSPASLHTPSAQAGPSAQAPTAG
ncbi:mechanosensitive ion channel protein MscS [Acidovorax sp. Leaf76]|uniref:mechanosensitive ion channel family protein n=1 Tax=unclassified Acidovorax TaxID=2684926 RepID=UPI0006F2DD19|nr:MULTISPECIES: mechanosensitive ion channel domain-containing protein [unclassified Acidovorax]KQO12502.1 mechanosensitive ion channel protein MscS [Acidovorax sp. Leaf76]KQO30111.1 mechanosensitive ion channel protein MscS [Acidovorax sp. Leaf84]KQS28820.1 mechanosensitive ion channel protein MscS [Acidovorax sp. Leaf191]